MPDIILNNQMAHSNPGRYGISKIGLRYVLSWRKLGLELKFIEAWTFGGFGKRAQILSDNQWIFTTGPSVGSI